MKQTIGIADYGQGNISSVENALVRLGAEVRIVADPAGLKSADKLVLPGVGNFDRAMNNLKQSGLAAAITDFAASGKLLLGICLGMQLLGSRSDEGDLPGLSLLDGEVIRLQPADTFRYKVPHNGWNTLTDRRESPLLHGITDEDHFFFLHAYRWKTVSGNEVLASTEYGQSFPVVTGRGNIFGVQFHPEKSHESGRKILGNFLNL